MSTTDDDALAAAVDLLAGCDMWHTPAVGAVPGIRMSDGPAGVRGTSFTGPASASFPCGTALAATFDPDLVRQVGEALGREARSKSAQVVLAPTVNLHRTPVGGRNFECMSEDPIHTAAIATAYVTGVQSRGIACCIKHLVGNDFEFHRFTVSSEIDEDVLREIYLVPFEAAVGAGVRAIMTAYNRLNGTYCSEHRWLLSEVVRREWGFDGVFISDWFGTHSALESLLAGLDVEMPGPPRHRGPSLREAIVDDDSARRAVAAAVDRIAELAAWTAAAESDGTETTDDEPATRAVIRRAAAAGTVLLANRDETLPLAPGAHIALIGPYATTGRIQGGGSAQVRPHRVVRALDALVERGYRVEHAPGCSIDKYLPVVTGDFEVVYTDRHGTRVERRLRRLEMIQQLGNEDGADRLDGPATTTITGTLRVETGGRWWIAVRAVGEVRVTIDGVEVIALDGTDIGGSFFGFGSSEVIAEVELGAGVDHLLEVHYPPGPATGVRGVIVGAAPVTADDLIPAAVERARVADVAVVMVGTNNDWETEGEDRAGIDLPGAQDELVAAVAAVARRTVVVVNAGSPVAMPWIDLVDAVLVMWFPGSQLGAALADVLSGDVEPGGRLPVTFPKRLADTPTAGHYPGDGVTMPYLERRRIGHRWYLDRGIEPLFWFGAGSGYTTFEWGAATIAGTPVAGVDVTVAVTNTGRRAGDDVVQVYVRYASADERRSERGDESGDDRGVVRFAGSAKVHSVPGAATEARVHIAPRSFMFWTDDGWALPPGEHEILLGRHAGALQPVGRLVV